MDTKKLREEFKQMFLPCYMALGSEAGWVVQEKISSWIQTAISKAREEGYKKGVGDGLRSIVFVNEKSFKIK